MYCSSGLMGPYKMGFNEPYNLPYSQPYMTFATEASAFYTPMNSESLDTWRNFSHHPTWPYDPPMTSYPYSSSYGSLDVRRKNATRESTSTLKAWLYEHIKNPYPTKGEKIMLAIITKMTLTQVSTWFANARRRLKKENKMQWSPRNRAGDDDDDKSVSSDDNDNNNNNNSNSGDILGVNNGAHCLNSSSSGSGSGGGGGSSGGGLNSSGRCNITVNNSINNKSNNYNNNNPSINTFCGSSFVNNRNNNNNSNNNNSNNNNNNKNSNNNNNNNNNRSNVSCNKTFKHKENKKNDGDKNERTAKPPTPLTIPHTSSTTTISSDKYPKVTSHLTLTKEISNDFSSYLACNTANLHNKKTNSLCGSVPGGVSLRYSTFTTQQQQTQPPFKGFLPCSDPHPTSPTTTIPLPPSTTPYFPSKSPFYSSPSSLPPYHIFSQHSSSPSFYSSFAPSYFNHNHNNNYDYNSTLNKFIPNNYKSSSSSSSSSSYSSDIHLNSSTLPFIEASPKPRIWSLADVATSSAPYLHPDDFNNVNNNINNSNNNIISNNSNMSSNNIANNNNNDDVNILNNNNFKGNKTIIEDSPISPPEPTFNHPSFYSPSFKHKLPPIQETPLKYTPKQHNDDNNNFKSCNFFFKPLRPYNNNNTDNNNNLLTKYNHFFNYDNNNPYNNNNNNDITKPHLFSCSFPFSDRNFAQRFLTSDVEATDVRGVKPLTITPSTNPYQPTYFPHKMDELEDEKETKK